MSLALAWSSAGGRACLRVDGWPRNTLAALGRLPADELARRISVLPSELADRAPALPPIAGELAVERDAVRFTPRHPFVDGLSYTVLVDGRPHEIRRPDSAAPATATSVVAIDPSAPELPLNALRLYVRFSAPMSEGWAARAVRVRRADTGAVLERTLLRMDPELWDPARTRLTLLLDPGRIKRGLGPHEESGYPLEAGVAVVVEVDGAFRDAGGRPLRESARRRYEVGAAVRARVEPQAWRVTTPAAATRAPLTVGFDRPLDRALLEHALSVVGAHGHEVAGRASIAEGERSWSFAPTAPWRPGEHRLLVAARLEDLAGNSLARVFDRDLTEAADDPLAITHAAVAFSC